jgi:hypothetical protein
MKTPDVEEQAFRDEIRTAEIQLGLDPTPDEEFDRLERATTYNPNNVKMSQVEL